MEPSPLSRRDFVATSGSAFGGAWLVGLGPLIAAAQACASDAMRDGEPLTVFTEAEGADFEAFAARIIPSDETPGAREAGVVYFADRALATFLAEQLPVVRDGLSELTARAGGEGPFRDLGEDRQDAVVGALEREAPGLFFVMRTLVVMGFVAIPQHGGNRDHVGWRLLGFEDRFVYQPPFGFYDRDEHADGPGDP